MWFLYMIENPNIYFEWISQLATDDTGGYSPIDKPKWIQFMPPELCRAFKFQANSFSLGTQRPSSPMRQGTSSTIPKCT